MDDRAKDLFRAFNEFRLLWESLGVHLVKEVMHFKNNWHLQFAMNAEKNPEQIQIEFFAKGRWTTGLVGISFLKTEVI